MIPTMLFGTTFRWLEEASSSGQVPFESSVVTYVICDGGLGSRVALVGRVGLYKRSHLTQTAIHLKKMAVKEIETLHQ